MFFFDTNQVAAFFDFWDRNAQSTPRWPMGEAPPYWSDLFVVIEFPSDGKLCIELAITRTGVMLRAYESIPPPEVDSCDTSIDTVATLITSPGGDLESNSSTSNGLQCTKECDVTADLRDAMLTGVGLTVMWTTRVEFRQPFTLYAYA